MAYDSCHQQIVNALMKAGWEIDSQSPYFRLPDMFVNPDIRAVQRNGSVEQIIVVEVKCFANSDNDLDELYRAIGQYLIYRSVLKIKKLPYKLYLAVPIDVYDRLFRRDVVSETIREAQIKMLLVDIDHEEVVQWLD
ncbi:MAG: hypothetical protein GC179_26500 [Anaerolineaceae bacterium]|nr:hypothetical protein [Anaerolineaceae bacterium]